MTAKQVLSSQVPGSMWPACDVVRVVALLSKPTAYDYFACHLTLCRTSTKLHGWLHQTILLNNDVVDINLSMKHSRKPATHLCWN